jgi:hypothetical protein
VTTAVSENPAIAYVAVRPAAGVRARTRIARKNERRAEAPGFIREVGYPAALPVASRESAGGFAYWK